MFRADSPPPRQPSPDFLPAPLPYPRHLPRRIQSQPRIRVHSPVPLPPGLHDPARTLQPARSCDYIRSSSSSRPPPARSHLSCSCSFSPDTSPSPSPAPTHSGRTSPSASFAPRHRRTLSVAFPSPSSSRSASPIPLVNMVSRPVTPAVPYRYAGPQHIVCPKPVPLAKQIVLPDIDEMTRSYVPPSPVSLTSHKSPGLVTQAPIAVPVLVPTQPQPQEGQVPPLEKHKSMGMACLKFFGLRTQNSRQPRPAMAAM